MQNIKQWGLPLLIAGFIASGVCISQQIESPEDQHIRLTEKHKKKVTAILENTIPESVLNGPTHEECDFRWVPILNKLIQDWAKEIIFQTNIAWTYLNEETWKIEFKSYRDDSYKSRELSTFEKRNLAVSYKMKGSSWQSLPQEQVRAIIQETGYKYWPWKHWICMYTQAIWSQSNWKWRSVNISRDLLPASEQLTQDLNRWEIVFIPKRAIWWR